MVLNLAWVLSRDRMREMTPPFAFGIAGRFDEF
jgi:hypothetical protein